MTHLLKSTYWFLVICLLSVSCSKDPLPDNPEKPQLGSGIFVLNEGLFNMNNASVTYYSFEEDKAHTDWFESMNGRRLGDTANDMAIYGQKLYIVVTGSSRVEVVDLTSGKSIAQIPLFDGAKPRQARNIAFLHNKAFVCSFDGTVAVIDTTSLEVVKYIGVGRNPDGIAAGNNKIYVSNSGGLDFPNYDHTVSVIDYPGLSEVKRIPVGLNPYRLQADQQGNMYVITRGDYDQEKMRLHIIDTQSDERIHTFTGFEALGFSIAHNQVYVYAHDFMGGTGSRILTLDAQSRELLTADFVTDGTVLQTVFGIFADPAGDRVYVADAQDYTSTGKVYGFNQQGRLQFSFKAGLIPGKIVVYNRPQ